MGSDAAGLYRDENSSVLSSVHQQLHEDEEDVLPLEKSKGGTTGAWSEFYFWMNENVWL